MSTMRARQKIRAPRKGLAARTEDPEAIWNVLASSLREIHTKNASSLSFEELYRNAYKLVLMSRGDDLYDRVKGIEREWLESKVIENVRASVSPGLLLETVPVDALDQSNERRAAGEKFLTGLKEVWEDQHVCMGMITDVLMYMDRVTCDDVQRPSIYIAAMCLFRDHVLGAPLLPDSTITILDALRSTILFMVQLEREGHIIERPLIRQNVYMLEGLYEGHAFEDTWSKLYKTVFEPAFIDVSRKFYQDEGERLLRTVDAATFCRSVSRRILEEEERCRCTLSPLSEQKIKEVLDKELIERRIADVIKLEGSGVKFMLDQDRFSDLALLYTLNSRIDKRKSTLTTVVQERVFEMGEEINAAAKMCSQTPIASSKLDEPDGSDKKKVEEKPINQHTAAALKWVHDILNLKKKFDDIWARAFGSDQGLHTSITKSFAEFINSNHRSSEYLSLFFDENLKKGIRGKTDNEIDVLLENGITLLRYVKDKDLFETYYKKHLSRRLLMKRSVSMDIERQMISKMKMEVGNQFTQRLEAMFKDVAVSEDLTTSYRDYVAQVGDTDKTVDLEVSVLTSTMWPMEIMSYSQDGAAKPPCILPREIDTVKQSFENFYLSKHNGRKLSWQTNMGTADIRAIFHKSNGKIARHELNVSTYAMIILLLFNDLPADESLTYEEIQAKTMIPDNDLVRNLQSLAVAPKTRVLKKDPMSKDVKAADRFFYNRDFHSMFTKVKIGVVSGGGNRVENQNERRETEKKMNEERGGSIEAAIVRIMKQRKNLPHSQLITEVLTQLSSRFVPDVNMVKRRIESLIDREYIERISDLEPPAYSYIA